MEWIELEKLGEILSGFAFKSNRYVSSGIRIIRITNVQNGYLEDVDPKFYSKTEIKGLERYLLFEKDILISLTGNVGRVAKVDKSFLPAALNQRVACIRANNKVLNDYLYYMLNSKYFEDRCISHSRGIAQKNLGITNLKEIKIPVPVMEIQEKIVEVLDGAQALIDKRKEQIQLLDSLIESTFYTMFGDPVKNEKGWDVNELKNIVLINPKKSEVFNIKESNLEISFIPMKDVGEDGVLSLKETRQIKDVYSGYTYFKENDVLFAKITPCMENGKSCIARGLSNEIGFGSTEFHVIRESPLLTKEYILQLVRNNKFKKEAESMMTGSAGQKRVHGSFLENYSISIPPLPLQNEFAGKVEAIEKQKKLLEKSLELLEENYKSIMDKAFKGQLFK